ncbi:MULTISPECIES: PrkA family serine protein kinase [Ramlibacter]|uniref:PrkA family serine protein kinase n=1 Tax=Ramlibacter pinisoli TaxID=2682844 RepID=A0A6N8IXG4_9BURK|nr:MULTISPECIES: PrkA family serine protein kinase [Ramlibacter]MBA2961594.1 PrkA family serine protein kinase [Ramlibacter sp. CGMCC 1.13660]MVQ31537.1 PrkA family serine protein kinase [Ramlibacter pinisoli]
MDVVRNFLARYEQTREEEMSLEDYLELCRKDPLVYATASERMLAAIGEPEMVDTRHDSRLSRIFGNKVIRIYPAFKDFYGLEEPIEQVVSHFRHAAQGLEEKKQILYLLGPVGGGKSSIAERLKQLMEQVPFYALKGSPVNESPLGLFSNEEDGPLLEQQFGIARRYTQKIMSPWAVKRLEEFGGDIRKFKVVKRYPSVLKQIGIAKTEPGDENNQDISSLVGKVDIRKLETYAQDDPDAYSYSGGLCLANQGLLEFVEMFKAPIKVLHPLLTATQEGNFKGTEGFGAIPFDGIVMAHSNESEWKAFKNNKNNEAFLDRIYIVKVPYCLRLTEEVKIYDKLLRNSSLKDAVCAPGTLKMMAQFSVLTRLKEPENSSIFSKMQIYDGENLKDTDPKAKSYQEYRDYAGVDEGMTGISTRFAFKILSKVFNFDSNEIAANPVHLMYVLEQQIEREQFPPETEQKYLSYIKEHLSARYAEFIGKEIQTAYLESYSEYGQNIFDRYVTYADFWIQDQEFRDTDTGEIFDRSALNGELEKIEKPAGLSNPKDFRNEIVNFVLRARANNAGKNPVWTSYEKLRTVIEKKMFSNTEDLLPVISFNAKASADEQKKHEDFVNRMVEKGYTHRQVRLLCEWYLRVRKSS